MSDFLKQFTSENYISSEEGISGGDIAAHEGDERIDRDFAPQMAQIGPDIESEAVDEVEVDAFADAVPPVGDLEPLEDEFDDVGEEALAEGEIAPELILPAPAPMVESPAPVHEPLMPAIKSPAPAIESPKPSHGVTPAAHEVKKDSSFERRKIARYTAIAGVVFAVCALALGLFYFMDQVTVRDFVGAPVTEARTWGIQNRITIEAREIYDLEHDVDIVISQERTADTRMNRGGVLRLTVSRGPDMTEIISLPNFEAMTTLQVREWREEVRAVNANINEEYNDEVPAGQFIRYEFTNPATTQDSYTRADGLLIFMSRGVQVFERNIPMPDLIDRPIAEAQEWAREQGVNLVITEDTDDDIAAGNISLQSVDSGEMVARNDDVEITVSKGASVTVPNFAEISFEDAAYPGLEVTVQRHFHANIAFGRLISQSISPGTELVGEGHAITVVYSLGRPYIDNLIGESESRLAEYFYSFHQGGANITYSIRYVDSYEPRGSIVNMSRFAQFVGMNQHIRVDVSRGNLNPPADALPPAGDIDLGE